MISSLARRWYIVVALLLVTLGLSFLVRQSVPSTYRAQASLVLMPPSSTVGPEGNPFLHLGGMGQALDILSTEVSAADNAKNILRAYPGVSYVAEPDRISSGAVIRVSVAGDNPNRVIAALRDTVALVPASLTSMQDEQGVPAASRISLMTLIVDTTPTEDAKSRTLSVAAAAGGGLALSLLLTGLIDGRMLARTQLRRSAHKSGLDVGTPPDHTPAVAEIAAGAPSPKDVSSPSEPRLTVDVKG